MNQSEARQAVRDCIGKLRPGVDVGEVTDDTPLLQERIITSLQVLDLILYLEQVSGKLLNRRQLQPGSFRDIATIARVFLLGEAL